MATLSVEQIPWDQLKAWGISRSMMEQSKDNMERLLAGRYTSPLSFYRSEGDMHLEGNAAIRCYASKDGVKIELQGIGPKITDQSKLFVFGVELSADQVKSLVETGHAGSLVQSKDGKKQFLVSLNKDTNRLVTYPAEGMTGPKDGMIAGVKLSDEQLKKYCAGEAVYLRGMQRSDGSRFDACAQFSAWTRRNDFTHPEWLRKSQEAEKKAKEALGQAVAEPAKQEQQEEKKGKGRHK